MSGSTGDMEDVMKQLREDFALVWRMRRAYGELSEDEMDAGKKAAGLLLASRKEDEEFLRLSHAYYGLVADMMRRDYARAERIRAEVRARR